MNKKFETSKILLLTVCIISFLLVCFVMYGWFVEDRTDATGLAGIVIAPAVTVIGFYSWKAKAENSIKIREYMKQNKLTDPDLLEQTNQQNISEDDSIVTSIVSEVQDIDE